MRIGAHQPEHLPWIGFFDRINQVDAFVLLDHVNFSKNNFQNRNRISNKKFEMWEWLTIPIFAGSNKQIREVQVTPREAWYRIYTEKIRHNYSKCRYYDEVLDKIQIAINQKSDLLFDINYAFIFEMLKYLKIETPIYRSSQMGLMKTKSEMLVEICQKLGGDEYVTGVGAIEYIEKEIFFKNKIMIKVRDAQIASNKYSFEDKRLSIIDTLMRNGRSFSQELNELPIQEKVLV